MTVNREKPANHREIYRTDSGGDSGCLSFVESRYLDVMLLWLSDAVDATRADNRVFPWLRRPLECRHPRRCRGPRANLVIQPSRKG